MLTLERIKRFAPNARADLTAALLVGEPELNVAGIVGNRLHHFLSRVAVETGGLKAIEENLNYSTEGLMKTFGRHRITAEQCAKFGRGPGRAANPEAIANTIYGGAWGLKNLGNTEPGDGWRYRGGGYLQNTGRANYRRAGHEDDPETLRQPGPGLTAAVQFWTARGCNALADAGDITALCRAINGGTNGLAEQRTYLDSARRIFT